MTPLTKALLQELKDHNHHATQAGCDTETNAINIKINHVTYTLRPHENNPTTYTLTKTWSTQTTTYDLHHPHSIQQLLQDLHTLRHQTSEQPKPT